LKAKLNTPLFFILGRERSGTTMLRVNLNNHPQINIPPESPFIIYLHNKYANKKTINLSEFINDLKKEPFLLIWNIDYDRLRERLQSINSPTFQNYCKEILNQHKQNEITVGDKNPIYSLFGNTLQHIYPEAKFIWIIRDYRAQVNSMFKVNFEKKIISSLAARWVAYNKEIEKLKVEHPNKVLQIKYEELVTSPENNYATICSFLDIPYNSDILDIKKNHKELLPTHHKSLKGKINTSHIDEWKTQLTEDQIKTCETVAGNYGSRFGYQKTHQSKTPITFNIYLGTLYGKLYIHFIKIMYKLPLWLRGLINKQLIYNNATFWKEAKKHYNN
jgi:hypothetical protein